MQFPFDQQLIIVLGFFTLILLSFLQKKTNLTSKKLFTNKKLQILVLIGLIGSCWFGHAIVLLITLPIAGGIILLLGGRGDPRYVAKKFVLYHCLALILYVYAISSDCAKLNPFFVIPLAILTALYPCSSWMDGFFLRSPLYFLLTWLIIIRVFLVKIFLLLIGSALNKSCCLLSILVYLTLFFVPILFFAKTEIRKLVSAITCWHSGYLWLFAMHLPTSKFHVITLLAITQGIFTAIILQTSEAIAENDEINNISKLRSLFEENYFAAVFIMSSLVFLIIMPLIFIFKRNMPPPSATFICQIVGSLILPAVFAHKLYKLMKSKPA